METEPRTRLDDLLDLCKKVRLEHLVLLRAARRVLNDPKFSHSEHFQWGPDCTLCEVEKAVAGR